MIVAKFGGSSLADAKCFRQVRDILASDPERRYVVVSAPGKRHEGDEKVTDLLLSAHRDVLEGGDPGKRFTAIRGRFEEIAGELGVPGCISREMDEAFQAIRNSASRDFAASRGEFLCGLLFSRWLSIPFLDAAETVRFYEDGRLDDQTTGALLHEALLRHPMAVLPGFYGADSQGNIRVFSRGGSDVSGALAAAAADADLYENWTDVTGFRSADPRIIPDASYIAFLTYRELRELSYMGATVLHEEAVFPVRRAGIPTSIRNTRDPLHPGTIIQSSSRFQAKVPAVTGIAGKPGFSVIVIEKARMNDEVGFGRKVLSVLEEHHISFEHLPTGIDALCAMVPTRSLADVREQVLAQIEAAVHPDHISVQEGIALVACVGAGIFKQHGTIARLFTAVSEQGIVIRTMFQAPSELSIIIGVNEPDLGPAVRAIYDAFIRN
jgi:aspartate kinase